VKELFNPHCSRWLSNKFQIYKDLRELDSAYWSGKYQMFLLTRYDDVFFALQNPEIFSSAKGNLIVEMPHRFGRTLGASDNPQHDFYKRIVKDAYGKNRLQHLSDFFKTKCEEVFVKTSNTEILNISHIIESLSAHLTTEILGLPFSSEKIHDLIVDIQKRSSRCVAKECNDESYDEFCSIVTDLVKQQIPAKRDGIYSEYMKNHPDGPVIMSLFTGPTISGTSSMTGALQFLLLDLYREKQLESVLACRDLISNAVNESLRFHASTGRFSRTVMKPITIHGVNLQPETRVAVCLESANRDHRKFNDPDKFDLYRDTSGHLAFGHGLHSCIALAISKMTMTVFLEVILEKIGNYKVITLPSEYDYVMTQSGNDDMICNLLIETIHT
jgi:cytochrome P450